jgi:hypothetical protein
VDSDALLVLPEYYFFPGEVGSVVAIYENRKILESNGKLPEWITMVFAEEGLGHNLLFSQPHPPRQIEPFPAISRQEMAVMAEQKGKPVFCHFIKPLVFGVVCETGSFCFFVISFNGTQFKLRKENPVRFHNFAIVSLFPGNHEILSYDREFLRIHTLNEKCGVYEVLLKNPKFSERICQISRSSLRRVPDDSRPLVIKLPDPIVCFASSAKFNVTAVGCEDGKLRIRSNETGLKVATVSLDGEVAKSILITPKWGFIVVWTATSLFLFSVNGVLGKKVTWNRVIEKWFAFHDRDGFDFVAFVDEDKQLMYFEAMDPDTVLQLPYEGTIVGFDYLARYNCFFIISDTGKLNIIPRT